VDVDPLSSELTPNKQKIFANAASSLILPSTIPAIADVDFFTRLTANG